MKGPVTTLALLACVLFGAGAALASSTCLVGTDPEVAGDDDDIASVRTAIDAACPCNTYDGSDGKTRHEYLACVGGVIASESATPPDNLRKQCKGTVKKLYAASTCGRDPALHSVACIVTSTQNATRKCSIKGTTDSDGVTPKNKCTSSATKTAVACPAFTYCLDAADTDRDLRITASDSGACPVVHDVEVLPGTAEYWLDDTAAPVAFSATPRDAVGYALPYSVTWMSSVPAVATVDAAGVATGLTAGPTTIEATANGVSGSASLCVIGSPTAELSPPSGSYSAQTLHIDASSSVGSCGRPLRYYWACTRSMGGSPNLCSTVVLPQNNVNTAQFDFPLPSGSTYDIDVQVCDAGDIPPPNNHLPCTLATITLTGT